VISVPPAASFEADRCRLQPLVAAIAKQQSKRKRNLRHVKTLATGTIIAHLVGRRPRAPTKKRAR
jgi:hypothetical protein